MEIEFKTIDFDKDLNTCIKFRKDSFVVSFGSYATLTSNNNEGLNRYISSLKERSKTLPDSHLHVWRGGQIIGQIEMRMDYEDEKSGYLNLIYLVPEMRGSGVASRLEERVIDFFREKGCKNVTLNVSPTNLRAIGFYKKCGWTQVGLVEKNNLKVVLMKKEF